MSDLLLRLARGPFAQPMAPETRCNVEALARKVHVAGRVAARYAPGWKKAPAAPDLESGHLVLLAGVLLAWSQLPPAPREEDRGLALKCLNAACAALELPAEPAPTGLLAALESRLAQLQDEAGL